MIKLPICIKEWRNGNEISVSMNDNLGKGFRGDVVVFHGADPLRNRYTEIDAFFNLEQMTEAISKAREVADTVRGTVDSFRPILR